MSRSAFLSLCLVTLIAIAAAVFSVLQQPRLRALDVAGEPLFPGLAERLDTLKSVVVRGEDGVATLEWDGKAWMVRERNGYPADGEKIAKAVLTMARMVKLEAKTAAEDRLERLQLNDPKAKGSYAKHISLLDRDGKAIADLIVGKRKFTLGDEGGTYVRMPNGAQSWLVLGDLSIGSRPGEWLKRDIVDIDEGEVKRVSVVHPDGEKVIVGKNLPSELNFKVENLPAGKQQASASAAGEFARVVSRLVMDDVAKAEEVGFPKDKTTTAEVETFAGLKITLQLMEKDGKAWVKARAEAPPADAKPPAGSLGRAPRDWAKLAAEINARADGWVFQLATYQVAPLQKRMADLILKPEPKSKF